MCIFKLFLIKYKNSKTNNFIHLRYPLTYNQFDVPKSLLSHPILLVFSPTSVDINIIDTTKEAKNICYFHKYFSDF